MSNRRRPKPRARARRGSGWKLPDGSAAAIDPWLAQCLDATGAVLMSGGNEFGPQYPGDDRQIWVLCVGCALPFQWWGEAMTQSQDPAGTLDPEQVKRMVAYGPCPYCGGAGKALSHMTVDRVPGFVRVATQPAVLDLLDLVPGLLFGQTTPPEAAATLRRESSDPWLLRIADAIETRPAAVGLAATLLGVAVSIGIAVADGNEAPSDEQIDRYIERVCEEQQHERAPVRPPQPRGTWLPQTHSGSAR